MMLVKESQIEHFVLHTSGCASAVPVYDYTKCLNFLKIHNMNGTQKIVSLPCLSQPAAKVEGLLRVKAPLVRGLKGTCHLKAYLVGLRGRQVLNLLAGPCCAFRILP